MQTELERIRDWAKDKLQSGGEPPWAWYQYMKLVETADAILAGMAATKPMPKNHLRVVEAAEGEGQPPITLPM